MSLPKGAGPFIYVNRSLKSSYHVIYTPREYLHKIILFAGRGAEGRGTHVKMCKFEYSKMMYLYELFF